MAGLVKAERPVILIPGLNLDPTVSRIHTRAAEMINNSGPYSTVIFPVRWEDRREGLTAKKARLHEMAGRLADAYQEPPDLVGSSIGGSFGIVSAGEKPGLFRAAVAVHARTRWTRNTDWATMLMASPSGVDTVDQLASRWNTTFSDALVGRVTMMRIPKADNRIPEPDMELDRANTHLYEVPSGERIRGHGASIVTILNTKHGINSVVTLLENPMVKAT